MNKTTIANTSFCYWSDEDECYVVESPLFETIAGVGMTQKQAYRVFRDLLDDAYEAYLEGRVGGYSAPGRPAKGGMPLNIDVKPETREYIRELAGNCACSQGEAIDLLALYHEKKELHDKSLGEPTPQAAFKMQCLEIQKVLEACQEWMGSLQNQLNKNPIKRAKAKESTKAPWKSKKHSTQKRQVQNKNRSQTKRRAS